MKKNVLKYVIAAMMLGSFGIAAMTLISMGDRNLSVFDIIQMGFTGTNDAGNFAEKMVLYSVKDYACPLAGLLVMIVFAAILTAALPDRHAYLVSLAEQVSVHIYVAALCMQVKCQSSVFEGIIEDTPIRDIMDSKVVEGILGNKMVKGLIGSAMENLGISGLQELGEIEIRMLPIFAWVALYIVILLLTVLGLCLGKAQIVPAGQRDDRTENVPSGEMARRESGRESEAPKAAVAQQGYQAVPAATGSLADSDFDSDFGGGIIGENGIYASKVYLMKDREPVYFCQEDRMLLLRKDVPEGPAAETSLAEICYVAEYREYRVKPMRRQAVFLKSGQPLGAGREYYLPRGMKVYIEDRNQTFTLA